jgi:hypothetical protein
VILGVTVVFWIRDSKMRVFLYLPAVKRNDSFRADWAGDLLR